MSVTSNDMIRESVRGFIAANFYIPDPTVFTDEISMVETGLVDSTGLIEVVAYVEQAFAIQVGDAEVLPENFDSVRNIVSFVRRKRERAACS